MARSSGNTYFSSRSPHIGHLRHPSNSDEQNIISHLLAPLPCEPLSRPYHSHSPSDNTQNISVQFRHSCTGQDYSQLDSDILQPRLHVDGGSPSMAVPTIAYPESSQRTTSHTSFPYVSDVSRFTGYSPSDLANLDIMDAPLHGPQPFRRSSWPSHPQVGCSPWTHSSPRIPRSPASEPPESTSDESYQDSDLEEATHMSPMMNQFQIHSSQNVDLAARHIIRTQSLQPSIMTFQLPDTMLVDDPENRHVTHSSLDTSIVASDQSDAAHLSPFSLPALSPASFGSAMLQGPGTRLQHESDREIKINHLCTPPSSFDDTPFSLHSPANSRSGDHRPTGAKQQKKSKMHRCEQCGKQFPRPSGLATHKNIHSGARPYKCTVKDCQKSFAVRSNAKRHLRTHGLHPSSPSILPMPSSAVEFEEPVVMHVHDVGRQPAHYRWIAQIQAPHQSEWPARASSSTIVGSSATALTFQESMSSTTSTTLSTGSDNECDQGVLGNAAVIRQYRRDYNRSTDGFSRDYPNDGEHSE